MNKEMMKKALEKVHYVGEAIIVLDMAIHIGQFAKKELLPLFKKNKKEMACESE